MTKDENRQVEAEGVRDVLDRRLKNLTFDAVVDWMNVRYAERALNYRERVRKVYVAEDGYVATVQGTELYETKLTVDVNGGFTSVCSCPLGGDCKHAGALAFVVSERLKEGLHVGASVPSDLAGRLAALWDARRMPKPPPQRRAPEPPPRRRFSVAVRENPFGRFTQTGGRHAPSFSFRVTDGGRTFHWDFIISTLIYSLARKGLSYRNQGWRWYQEEELTDPPLFTCSCGDVECGGFGEQHCTFTEDDVRWEVDYGRETIEFVFERLAYETWVLEMLWRMRGGRHLRRDPWAHLLDLSDFKTAMNALLLARPRCREMWRVLSQHRRFSAGDKAAFALMREASSEVFDFREFFGCVYSTRENPDLRCRYPLYREREHVRERLKNTCVGHFGCFAYLPVYVPYWRPTEIHAGDRLAFVREAGGTQNRPIVRVDSLTRGVKVGCFWREDAQWLAAMMDRHGMLMREHVEPVRREGKGLLVRVDFSFARKAESQFDWGHALGPRERMYFEMLRTLARTIRDYPVAVVQAEMKRLDATFQSVKACPEIAFLFAVITAAAQEVEARMMDEVVARRIAWCARVRRAMSCKSEGAMLVYRGFQILPLVAPGAVVVGEVGEIPERARHFIRRVWGPDPDSRVKVELPDFPNTATGFAVFRNGELLDLCLTGVPVGRTGLFDNLALYAEGVANAGYIDEATAFARVTTFLDNLPIRGQDDDTHEIRYWLEHGIHDGTCVLDDQDRLVSLRIVMKSAREVWCD